jgi:hypothetical protein
VQPEPLLLDHQHRRAPHFLGSRNLHGGFFHFLYRYSYEKRGIGAVAKSLSLKKTFIRKKSKLYQLRFSAEGKFNSELVKKWR